MSLRIRLATCAVICCLLLAVAGSAFADHTNTSPYFKIYQQDSPDWWDRTHNIFWCNVMPDGTCYAGGNTCAPQQWRDEQVNGTAVINWGSRFGETSKSVVPLNGHLYSSGANGAFIEQDAWNSVAPTGNPPYNWTLAPGYHVLKNAATGYYIGGANGIPDGNANNKQNIQAVVTDGTYIYSNDNTSTPTDLRNVIHKWSVNETDWIVTDAPGWPVSIGSATTCRFSRGMCLYKGSDGKNKICALNTVNNEIYEIDCESGAYSLVISAWTPTYTAYSVARYGNDIFVPEYTGGVNPGLPQTWVLRNFHYDGTSWVAHDYDLGIENPYYDKAPVSGAKTTQIGYFGIGLKGDGTNAQYMWVTSAGAQMSFWALDPWTTAPALSLIDARKGTAFKAGYPVKVQDAVVTTIGTDGFWVEDKDRIGGAHVLWTGEMPARNTLVNINGGVSTTNSGEKVMTAASVTPGSAYAVRPLLLTNKSLGVATGGAGLANDGMLVTVYGKVTHFDYTDWAFYIDDGSGATCVAKDQTAVTGVKVLRADGMTGADLAANFDLAMYGTPCYAVVTGVVRLEKQGNKIVRAIGARGYDDIVITALP